MKKTGCYLLFVLFPALVSAQTKPAPEGGASLSFSIEKDLLKNLTVNIEEEIRLQTGRIGFDRTVSTAGLDCSLFGKKVKTGIYCAFIYLYNDDYLFEPRCRFYLNLSYRENIEAFTLSWRIRLQETVRDGSRGSYRINPRYTMKNRLEMEYSVWGKPWKPFLSCDLSTNLNDPETRYDFVRLRFQGGANWRLNRTASIDMFLRWDEYLTNRDSRIISLGICYRMKL
jgi:hypothetical protein